MHYSTVLTAVAAMAPLVAAHDGSALPKIIGLNMRDLKTRSLLSNMMNRAQLAEAHHDKSLEARQITDGRCGAGYGTCAAGYCCSTEGWCGNTADYCFSPGCQYTYGPACPENVTPAGTNTSTVARTKVGSVEYGGNGIYQCVTPGDVAITYDDGPIQNYTDHILDIFKSYNQRATFFVTGNNINKGQIDTTANHIASIKRAYADGHQIASHTWTHLDLSAVPSIDRKNQMWKNEMALRNILGFFPTYMRPPYSSCTAESGCETDMANLGYHVTYFDVDTDDYNQDDPSLIQNSKNRFRNGITAGGATAANNQWLAIAHDIHVQTAYNLTDYMLSTLTTLGYKAVTVGECLGDPKANWYRSSSSSGATSSSTRVSTTVATSTRSSTVATASPTKRASTDGTCAGTTGFTCAGTTFGNCCSSAGWCGSTEAYCGTGCQSGFGSCTGSTSSAPVSSVRSSVIVTSTKTSSSAKPTATKKVTTDATCGGTNGYTCQGSTFGNCCSSSGYCGTTTAYCGTGCQSGFGTCGGSSSALASTKTSTSASPVATKKVTTDATCGGTNGYTCQGSTFGNCCSSSGYCGTTTAYCGTGCQKAFGTCT